MRTGAHEALDAPAVRDEPQGPSSEVVALCSELIRFDTTNPGKLEQHAALYIADLLREHGWKPDVFAVETGRTNIIVRIPGTDRTRPALLVHGHIDVVPVDDQQWTVDPFGGDVHDGHVWGRGAVDMKDMLAMMLSLARHYGRTGERPARDVVMAFLADEEAGGYLGAAQLSTDYASLIAGCTEAIGEVGGFSVALRGGVNAYLVQTAEKGVAWLRLTASGPGGHGSMIHSDNPLQRISGALQRLAGPRPVLVTPAAARMLSTLAELAGAKVDLSDPRAVRDFVRSLGPISRLLEAALSHTYNPTMMQAGVKENVVPDRATALVDGRYLPGLEDDFRGEVARLLAPAEVDWSFEKWLPAVDSPADQDLLPAMGAALSAEDPCAAVAPMVLAAGTDAKWFSAAGISCYGFIPLRLPADFDFAAQFHAADEHVPVDALTFGARVLHRLLAT